MNPKKMTAVLAAASLTLLLHPLGGSPSAATAPPASPKQATDPFVKKLNAMYEDIEKQYRPDVRWWLAEGLNTDATLRKNIQEISDSGFGAAEFLAMPEEGADDKLYGWGSEEWTADSQLIMKEATRLGLGFSLTSGTHWSHANLPDTFEYDSAPFDPDNKGASKSLDYTTVMLNAGQSFNDALPLPHDKPAAVDDVVFEGVVAAKVAEPRSGAGVDGAEGTGTGTIEIESLKDLSSQVTESDGRYSLNWTAPDDGQYAIFTYWMYGTAQTGEPSVSTNYTVNYIDAYGIDALKQYWQQTVLTDELREMLRANGRGEIYMDSLELEMHGAVQALWGYDFKKEFRQRRGYDITPYLPFISADRVESAERRQWDYSAASATDSATLKKVRDDFHRTQTDMYTENVLKPLQSWLHGYGMTLRAEPSYGFNDTFEISTPAKYLDGVETETFAQNADVDLYRGLLGGAHMYNRPFSSETGAVLFRNYYYDEDYWTRLSYLQFAAGVNRTVFHGYSGIEGSEADTQWPGHEGMYSVFSERFNSRQPGAAGYPEWTEMLGRNQKVLRQGQAQRDIAILRTDYSFAHYPKGLTGIPEDNNSMHDKPYYWKDTSLQQAGYTYDYFSPQLLDDTENVDWTNKVLQPNGPSYKAVIVYQESMELNSARRLLEIASDGLPVVFVNNTSETLREGVPDAQYAEAASRSASLAASDAELKQVVDQIKALPNVRVLDKQADTLSTLRDMGVQPRVAFTTPNNKILTISRFDKRKNILYTFAYAYKFEANKNDGPFRFDLSMDAVGKPYTIEDWTGEVEPVGTYDTRGGRTNVGLTLKPGESTIVALNLNNPGNGLHALSTDADRVVDDGTKLSVLSTKSGTFTTELSNGRSATTEVSVPSQIPLTDWDLTLEDWNEGDRVVNTEEKFGHVTKEVYYTTKKTLLEFPDTALVPWKDLPASPEQLAKLTGEQPSMSHVSGIGTYETTFDVPATWSAENGALLRIGSTNGNQARVFVNGEEVRGLDLRTLVVDIGDHLKVGSTNDLKVVVASTLTNRMLQRGYGTTGPAQDYGMVGDVRIVPFTVAALKQSSTDQGGTTPSAPAPASVSPQVGDKRSSKVKAKTRHRQVERGDAVVVIAKVRAGSPVATGRVVVRADGKTVAHGPLGSRGKIRLVWKAPKKLGKIVYRIRYLGSSTVAPSGDAVTIRVVKHRR